MNISLTPQDEQSIQKIKSQQIQTNHSYIDSNKHISWTQYDHHPNHTKTFNQSLQKIESHRFLTITSKLTKEQSSTDRKVTKQVQKKQKSKGFFQRIQSICSCFDYQKDNNYKMAQTYTPKRQKLSTNLKLNNKKKEKTLTPIGSLLNLLNQ